MREETLSTNCRRKENEHINVTNYLLFHIAVSAEMIIKAKSRSLHGTVLWRRKPMKYQYRGECLRLGGWERHPEIHI